MYSRDPFNMNGLLILRLVYVLINKQNTDQSYTHTCLLPAQSSNISLSSTTAYKKIPVCVRFFTVHHGMLLTRLP